MSCTLYVNTNSAPSGTDVSNFAGVRTTSTVLLLALNDPRAVVYVASPYLNKNKSKWRGSFLDFVKLVSTPMHVHGIAATKHTKSNFPPLHKKEAVRCSRAG